MPPTEHVRVFVFMANPSLLEPLSRSAKALALLAPEERERVSRIRAPRDRAVALASRVLQRRALSAVLGWTVEPAAWRFEAAPLARPRIIGPAGVPPLSWSASNAVGLVACAVAFTGDIGIDVEPARGEAPMEIAEAYFAASEREMLVALPPPARARRFLEIWTLKEAYAKARGQGLALPLAALAFDPTTRPVGFRMDAPLVDDSARWHLFQWWVDTGHCLALCVREAAGRLPEVSVTWDDLG